MSMDLSEKTWPDIQKYLKIKKTIILPVGSTEQHGPTGILGIDYLTAWNIALKVGDKTNTLVAPPLCFGMAMHHMAFPGTITLTPSTYVLVISELLNSLSHHGFKKIIIINGHGGNIAPITTAMSQALQMTGSFQVKLINWWHLKEVNEYENQVFGAENGFHATCGEISTTMHTHPLAYKNIKMKQKYVKSPCKYPWPLSPEQFKKTFRDGRMLSNPSLANAHHGKKIFSIAVEAISHAIRDN